MILICFLCNFWYVGNVNILNKLKQLIDRFVSILISSLSYYRPFIMFSFYVTGTQSYQVSWTHPEMSFYLRNDLYISISSMRESVFRQHSLVPMKTSLFVFWPNNLLPILYVYNVYIGLNKYYYGIEVWLVIQCETFLKFRL